MQTTNFNITGSDKHPIPVYGWVPDTDHVCIVHVAHGMAEYALRYASFAAFLVSNGIAVYAHDQLGHGKAVENTDQLGITPENWFNKQVDDLNMILLHLKITHPGKKIFLLGHSMGSFVCQRYFQLYGNEINGLMLSATNGKKDPLMDIGIALAWMQKKIYGSKYRSKLINLLSFGKFNNTFKPNRTFFDWLSRDHQAVDAYIKDPLCGFICSAAYFYDFFRGINDCFNKKNINNIAVSVPVYAFAGDKDPVGLFGKGFIRLVEHWKAAGIKDIEYKLYKDGRHEMLNEINHIEVKNDLINWIFKHNK